MSIRAGVVAVAAGIATAAAAGTNAPLAADAATEAYRAARAGGVHRPHAMTMAPAKWIWLPSQRTLPNSFVLFRREIVLPAAPARADGWIAADSRYRLTVNGRRVQWGPAPCDPRNLDADPVDLKPFLVAGTNVVGVEVLFYGHGEGTWPGGKPGLILNLAIESDGASRRVVTDKEWMSLLDRAHPPGQYKRWFLRALQEEFDARLHPAGWDAPGFVPDARWIAAHEFPCPPDKGPGCRRDRNWSADTVDHVNPAVASLRMRQIPPCRETVIPAKGLAHSGTVRWLRDPDDWFDVRMPGSFEVGTQEVAVARGDGAWELPATPGPGRGIEATFEFREQAVGFPCFAIDAPGGTIVEVMTQEGHDPAATHWLDSHHFSWSRFVCREGANEFDAFDYESFRWLQLHVRNASRSVTVRGVGIRRREYGWSVEPVNRTSEAPLQRLFDAGINTLRNSVIETAVDGMGRERQQYSGDGGHQMHAVRYAFGEPAAVARYLRTFSEGLTKSGYFLDSYPAYDRLARLPQRELEAAYWGPLLDHGVGFVFDNWNHVLETGDREAVCESWPRLVRFADYLWGLRGADGLLPVENLGVANVWIDHDAYRGQRNRQCAFNLYAAAMFSHALVPLAAELGDAVSAERARARGAELLAASVAAFWSPEHRAFLDNRPWLAEDKGPRMSDRALATSILFDQCPGGDTAEALKALAEVPKTMGLSYPCNAGWRYWALAKLGRADVVIRDLRTRWATMRSVVENNTLQEPWQVRPDSLSQWSHCPLAPIFVLHQDLVGLRPLAPGFARLQLRPQLGDLPDLHVVSHTPRGAIEFRSRRDGDMHHVEVAMPRGCEAELVLPAGAPCALSALPAGGDAGLARYRMPGGVSRFVVPVHVP